MSLDYVAINGAVLRAATVLVKYIKQKHLDYLGCDLNQKPLPCFLHLAVNIDKMPDIFTQ